jgi:NADH-quinone oxidoreductase subunit J
LDPAPILIHPVILYSAIALGAVGVGLALPRKGVNPQIIGALVASAAAGLVILFLSLRAINLGEGLPNPFFYIFSVIALGASLRVITHPRPVYAALFFILTIISSAGLYLILAAEFMAFALIIVYAGAILITYLFVIMLATQAPSEEEIESLTGYDAASREPIAATFAGFVLLAVLTSMLFAGAGELPGPVGNGGDQATSEAILARLPGKIERELREKDLMPTGAVIVVDENGLAAVDFTATEAGEAGGAGNGAGGAGNGVGTVTLELASGETRDVPLPAGLGVSNVERVGMNLLADYPGLIEIAGIILLMAMLGAIVLARRKTMADDEDKAAMAAELAGMAGRVEGGAS